MPPIQDVAKFAAHVGGAGEPEPPFGGLQTNGSVTVTDILVTDTYQPVVLSGTVGKAEVQFTVTDETAGIIRYDGTGRHLFEVHADMSISKVGAQRRYRFALSINGVDPDIEPAPYTPVDIRPALSQVIHRGFEFMSNGDTVQVMVLGVGTIEDPVLSDILLTVRD